MFDFSDEKYVTVLALGVVGGLLLSYIISQDSQRHRPIYGGLPAQLFHYIGCIAIGSILPTVIIGIISGLHILQLISLGLIYMATTAVSMLIYGFFESQAPPMEAKPVRELD